MIFRILVSIVYWSEITVSIIDMNLPSQQPSLHAVEVTLLEPAVGMLTSDLVLTSVDSTTRLGMC